jgi:hypothetical protein
VQAFDNVERTLALADDGWGDVVSVDSYYQQEALALIDQAIRDATNGRLGGPVEP